jgi:predicted SAM-dependent methyltransferase
MLKECFRILKDGGRIIISNPGLIILDIALSEREIRAAKEIHKMGNGNFHKRFTLL